MPIRGKKVTVFTKYVAVWTQGQNEKTPQWLINAFHATKKRAQGLFFLRAQAGGGVKVTIITSWMIRVVRSLDGAGHRSLRGLKHRG